MSFFFCDDLIIRIIQPFTLSTSHHLMLDLSVKKVRRWSASTPFHRCSSRGRERCDLRSHRPDSRSRSSGGRQPKIRSVRLANERYPSNVGCLIAGARRLRRKRHLCVPAGDLSLFSCRAERLTAAAGNHLKCLSRGVLIRLLFRFRNILGGTPLLFSNVVPTSAYYRWRDQHTSRQDKRKVVEMLFLHLKPGSHWRIVAYGDRGTHSVDEPHVPLMVVRDEADGTLTRSAKMRERAILGWEESPQPDELPN